MKCQLPLQCLGEPRSIMEEEAVAVRREDEWNVDHLAIFESLLHAGSDGVVVVLGFDDRNRDVGLVVEDVVHALARSPLRHAAPN